MVEHQPAHVPLIGRLSLVIEHADGTLRVADQHAPAAFGVRQERFQPEHVIERTIAPKTFALEIGAVHAHHVQVADQQFQLAVAVQVSQFGVERARVFLGGRVAGDRVPLVVEHAHVFGSYGP